MFIMFGWGKQTVKEFGSHDSRNCPRCNNRKPWIYRKYTTWFTLFFIPVIPYSSFYAKTCPICGHGEKMGKEAFMNEVEMSLDPYGGKTETQANYLMEIAGGKDKVKEDTDNHY